MSSRAADTRTGDPAVISTSVVLERRLSLRTRPQFSEATRRFGFELVCFRPCGGGGGSRFPPSWTEEFCVCVFLFCFTHCSRWPKVDIEAERDAVAAPYSGCAPRRGSCCSCFSRTAESPKVRLDARLHPASCLEKARTVALRYSEAEVVSVQ